MQSQVLIMDADHPDDAMALEMTSNTDDERVVENCAASIARGLPELAALAPATDVPLCICGGGPSIEGDAQEILARAKNGQHVWALNGTHDWLIERGIVPNAAWCVDSQPDNVRFYRKPRADVRYYIASRADPLVFDALKGLDVTLWHDESCQQIVPNAHMLIGGGGTIGIKALPAAYVCGYRTMHLYGYDSSYRQDAHHAYAQPMNDGETVYPVRVGEHEFMAAAWMIRQVQTFGLIARKLANEHGCAIHVHGDGFLPRTAVEMARAVEVAA